MSSSSSNTYASHVEITSSFAAMLNKNEANDYSSLVTEESWIPVAWGEASHKDNAFVSYMGSKKYAEKVAWGFIKSEKPSLGLTTVNPGCVFGSGIALDAKSPNSTTNGTIIQGHLSTTPGQDTSEGQSSCVCHRQNLENQRLMPCVSKLCNQDLRDTVNKEVPDLKGKTMSKPERS
ncbi:Conserved hypothetical protein [Yarrowia lipolytica]|nr:Conserved hypothetical protein [Yarrowia lipolytica]